MGMIITTIDHSHTLLCFLKRRRFTSWLDEDEEKRQSESDQIAYLRVDRAIDKPEYATFSFLIDDAIME